MTKDLLEMNIAEAEAETKANSGVKQEPITEGKHICRLYKIMDTGTQAYTSKQYGDKAMRKMMFSFEVLDENIEFEKDGEKVVKPKVFTVFKNVSFHEKSKFVPFLKEVYGKKPTNVSDVMGSYVMINFEHTKADNGNIYENIVTMMNVDDMENNPKAVNEDCLMLLFPSKFNKELYDNLKDSDFNNNIKETIEYKRCIGKSEDKGPF